MRYLKIIISFSALIMLLCSCSFITHGAKDKEYSQEQLWDYRPMVYVNDGLYLITGKYFYELPSEFKYIGTIKTTVPLTEHTPLENFSSNDAKEGASVYCSDNLEEGIYVEFVVDDKTRYVFFEYSDSQTDIIE